MKKHMAKLPPIKFNLLMIRPPVCDISIPCIQN